MKDKIGDEGKGKRRGRGKREEGRGKRDGEIER